MFIRLFKSIEKCIILCTINCLCFLLPPQDGFTIVLLGLVKNKQCMVKFLVKKQANIHADDKLDSYICLFFLISQCVLEWVAVTQLTNILLTKAQFQIHKMWPIMCKNRCIEVPKVKLCLCYFRSALIYALKHVQIMLQEEIRVTLLFTTRSVLKFPLYPLQHLF